MKWKVVLLKWPLAKWAQQLEDLEDSGWDVLHCSVDPGPDGGLFVVLKRRDNGGYMITEVSTYRIECDGFEAQDERCREYVIIYEEERPNRLPTGWTQKSSSNEADGRTRVLCPRCSKRL